MLLLGLAVLTQAVGPTKSFLTYALPRMSSGEAFFFMTESPFSILTNMAGADLEERSGKTHHDVAVPAIFLIDSAGVIRWSHADPDYAKRPSVPQILEAIDRSGVAPKASTATVTGSSSPALSGR